MKPTTTSVFASPVRLQTSSNRTIHGLSGCAAVNVVDLSSAKPSPEGEGWVRGNQHKEKSLIITPHPNLLLEGDGAQILKSTALRAAGAHRPCLPAAQDGQTKSLPGPAGGSLNMRWGCRLFFLLLLNFLGGLVYADNSVQKLTGNSTAIATATAQLAKDQVQSLTGTTAASAKVTRQLAATCQSTDDNLAPAMVAIKPGQFQMGSPATETGRSSDEDPQHLVTIPRPFAISRCEITVGQFKQFILDTGYKTTAETDGKGCYSLNTEKKEWQQQADSRWDNPGFAQTDKHPVVCVSWHDAQRYLDWLSQRTGALYRLPTEAEWEYAARAGTETPRFYVDNKQCDYANGLGQEAKSIADKDWVLADCNDIHVYTAPVASFAGNQFGLFDMLGNVWEWTLDCWHGNYQQAPPDSTAWLESDGGACDRRVVRGGSWNDDPLDLRSAVRDWINSNEASDILGFRVARAL